MWPSTRFTSRIAAWIVPRASAMRANACLRLAAGPIASPPASSTACTRSPAMKGSSSTIRMRACSKPRAISITTFGLGDELLRRGLNALMLKTFKGGSQGDANPLGFPIEENIATELPGDAHPSKSAPETRMSWRTFNWRATKLCPSQDQHILRGAPLDGQPSVGHGERAVFGSVGGELVQHQRKARCGRRTDREVVRLDAQLVGLGGEMRFD